MGISLSSGDSTNSRGQSLRLSLFDAFIYALMVGAGETYLPAYVLSVGLSEVLSGVVSSLPMVSGAFLQLLSPRFLQIIGNHKKLVIFSVIFQALSFIPLVYFTVFTKPDFWSLFVILTLYWGAGLAASPPWIYWMGRLVPEQDRQSYFAKRARIVQIGTLIGLIAGGVALHNKVILTHFGSVFTLLFVFAFLCRIVSSVILSRKVFVEEWVQSEQLKGVKESLKIFWKDPSVRNFCLLLMPYQAAIFVTAPFVSPYMLGELKWNYGQYMVAVAFLFIGKMIGLFWVEKTKKAISPTTLFLVGAGLVAPGPALWSLYDGFVYIVVLQLWSGMAWSLFEVGLQLRFFSELEHDKKVASLTVYNLLNSISILSGTFIGGQMLLMMGEDKSSYWVLFYGGALLRGLFFMPLWFSMRAKER